jgi:iron complex outermembrane receptor protein
MTQTVNRNLLQVIAVAMLAQVSGAAMAQTAASETAAAEPGLEEVIVTATRRQERLQDVPISVTAFSQEKLDAQGLRDIDDLTRLSPGVTFQRNGMGSAANYNDENSDINIRGIDSTAGTSTTGIYIDDTPIQSRHISFGAVNAFPALFDLDRVEVLRGPQGTLFGAGSEGGTVRFITPEPGLTQSSGYVRSELATTRNGDPSYEVGAAAGGPIIDDVLGFRVSASFRHDGGYVDRVSYTLTPNPAAPDDQALSTPTYLRTLEPRANWQETETLRGALKWAVNDAVSIEPSFYYQKLYINDTAAYWVSLSDPGADQYRNGNALSNPSTDPLWLAAVKVSWNLGFAQLVSNTSYYSRNQHSISDYTQYLRASFLGDSFPAAGDAGYAPFGDQQQNFYEEIRLASSDATARVTWNTGVFYSHQNENISESIYDATLNQEVGGFLCAAVSCPGGLLLNGPESRFIDKQLALFGEANVKVTETLKATAGLRVSKVDYDAENYAYGAFLGPIPTTFNGSASEKPVTPKFVLSYQPDRDELFYASAAKGYRVGGVNGPVATTCAGDLASIGQPGGVPRAYSSDSLWSYEIGAKNTLLDHRLQIDASLFTIDWKNIQQNVYLPDCGNQFTANLGQVRSRGGELEAQFRPVQPLLLDFSVAYTDAKFTKTSCAGTLTFDGSACTGAAGAVAPIVSAGDRLVGAPWTFLSSAEYSFAAISEHTPYLRVDYQYTTAQTALLPGQDDHNALYDTTIPGLPVTKNLSLRGGMRWSGFDVSMFCNNVTDQHPLMYESRDIAAPFDQLYFARTWRPRTLGVTATYRY